MECYYNEYSSKIVNKVIEKKVIRDNRGHFGSVCDVCINIYIFFTYRNK